MIGASADCYLASAFSQHASSFVDRAFCHALADLALAFTLRDGEPCSIDD